jgi:hypothetical protein
MRSVPRRQPGSPTARTPVGGGKGEKYAEPRGFPLRWDAGAPMPHRMVNDNGALLVFLLSKPAPAGTGATSRSRVRVTLSRRIVLGGTGWADDHFLEDLLAFSTRIIRVVLFAFARLIGTNERVSPGTIRVLLAAPFQDKVLAGSPGRHDALTQLTTEHGNEPRDRPSGWLMSRKGCTPRGGAEQKNAALDEKTSAGENTQP